MRTTMAWCAVVVLGSCILSGTTYAQNTLDRDEWVAPSGDWSDDDNWIDDTGLPSGAPTTDDDRWALVGSGTALVSGSHQTSGLTVSGSGIVEIQPGASLEVALTDGAFSVGQTQISGRGTLRVLGDGSYKGLDASASGIIELSQASTLEFSGDADFLGTLSFESGATVSVEGIATVGGSVLPQLTAAPSFGDVIPFVEAGSVQLANPSLELPDGVELPRGLQANISATNTTASIEFSNFPILQVDRGTQQGKIMNVVGDPIAITGYTIQSGLGLLNPEGFSGFGGAVWDRPDPLNTSLVEFNLTETASVSVDSPLEIGEVYNVGPTAPEDEDVTFLYFTPDGEIREGLVEYTGPANDLVLNVNPDSGEVTIQHLSPFIDPIEVTGYSVISLSDSLKPDEFTSLEDAGESGWLEANPASGFISEVNTLESMIFDNGTVVSLGNIFDNENGTRDLVLQYTTTNDLFTATTEYQSTGDGPPVDPGLEADFDGNGSVDFADFLTLSNQFGQTVEPPGSPPDISGNGLVDFADFLVLSSQFGQSSNAASAVPEPSGLCVIGIGSLFVFSGRRRRESIRQKGGK